MRICVIGSGPSGLSVLYHLAPLTKNGYEIVCYEKGDDWGGLWRYSWRTGIDGHGEPVHHGMYRYLWSNGPKECLEYPDYTWVDHFGKATPSFPPRAPLHDYLTARAKRGNFRHLIKFNTLVKSVTFNPATKKFTVTTKDLNENQVARTPESFDYVINATGHFSTPTVPYFKGIETFPGRVLHSHDFRSAEEFQNKSILVIGSSYSAEDIALQCNKFGSGPVICSWRTAPMNFNWPKGIEERPLVKEIKGKTIMFVDDSNANVDAIIVATGYEYYFPFLPDDLRLRDQPNTTYPPNLYKGVLWCAENAKAKEACGHLFYMGMQDQYYSYTLFDAQAMWIRDVILGKIKLPSWNEMVADWKKWVERRCQSRDCHHQIDVQTDHIKDLIKDVQGYQYDLDVGAMFHKWEHDRDEDIATYRDAGFMSKFSGVKGSVPKSPWAQNKDDSLENFVAQA